MRHRGGHGRHLGGALRIARVHPAPAIDEDLAADLLGHRGAVGGDGARFRRLHAGLEVLVGGVLGGIAEAAPPVHAVLLGGVVEPGPADIGGRRLEPVVAQRADEIDRAVGVVVGGEVLEVAQVLRDLAIGVADPLIAPDGRLDRGAEAHADGLAEKAGIDAVEDFGGGEHGGLVSEMACAAKAPSPAAARRALPRRER